MRSAEELVILIGSNPLPNLVACHVLEPSRVLALATPQTLETADDLEGVLTRSIPGLDFERRVIEDAADPRQISSACYELTSPDSHLHYSGGTKVMAAYALVVFREKGGSPANCSYLDERANILRFDDGEFEPLDDVVIDIEDLAAIHGFRRSDKGETGEDITDDVAAKVGKVLLKRLQEHKNKGLKRRAGFSRAKQSTADHLKSEKIRKPNVIARGGFWLERMVANQIEACFRADNRVCYVETNSKWEFEPGRDFELDVVAVSGHRLYTVSCTVSPQTPLCKNKLFEASLRARQLGGDMSRSALACLIYEPEKENPEDPVQMIRDDVSSSFRATNRPEVFGLDELCEWFGIGCAPNMSTLKNWLSEP